MSIILLNINSKQIRERRYDRPNYPDPSLGSLYSYLKNNNIECNIIDSKLERLSLSDTIKKIKQIGPVAIGFTSFTHEIEKVAYAAAMIKRKISAARLIIGGSHSNAVPSQILEEFPVFDIAVHGEGEATFTELVNNNFDNLKNINGIAYRSGKDVIINDSRPLLDMKELPVLDWSLFPRARYYPIFTSRGCPYHCVFCSRPFGSSVRYKPIAKIINEIRGIKELFNCKRIYFWDENFCSDRNRTLELLTLIKDNKTIRGIKWFCQTHINNLDFELLRLMKASGCVRIGIGIESGNEEILKRIGKGITKKKIMQVVDLIKKVKIPFYGYFLFGLPGETRRTCMDTIKFATRINPKFPVFGIVVPYPGTEIYNMAIKSECGYKIISKRWSDYNKIIGGSMELETLSRRELETLQLYGYFSVLIKNFRFFDIIRFAFQFLFDIKSYIINFFKSRNN